MRVLVTIPHYFRRAAEPDAAPAFYGSEREAAAVRRDQVQRCLAALAQCFGPRQSLAGTADGPPANDALAVQMDVVLVTTGTQHLVDDLPRHLFLHFDSQSDPRCLGFVCHNLMRENANRYDLFAYLEDDLEITDPLFLAKVRWFAARFGPDTLLQPNRFELADNLEVMKLYLDGNTVHPEIPALFQDITAEPALEAEAFGLPLLFKRVSNVHSGCFFVTAEQLARLAALPQFGQPSAEFFGPLETAATLPAMLAFRCYKPARRNAGFLEMRHMGQRFLFQRPSEA